MRLIKLAFILILITTSFVTCNKKAKKCRKANFITYNSPLIEEIDVTGKLAASVSSITINPNINLYTDSSSFYARFNPSILVNFNENSCIYIPKDYKLEKKGRYIEQIDLVLSETNTDYILNVNCCTSRALYNKKLQFFSVILIKTEKLQNKPISIKINYDK